MTSESADQKTSRTASSISSERVAGPTPYLSQILPCETQERLPSDKLSGAAPLSTVGESGAGTIGIEQPIGGRPRLFGLRRDILENAIPPVNYEQRYAGDRFGEEMGSSARVWRTYIDEANVSDRDMVEGWRDGIDVLLVFAGLFSAVVTTFVTRTYQKLDVDYSQVSASLLTELINIQRALANGTSVSPITPSTLTVDSPPKYIDTDIWVNALLFTSLAFGLVAALAAVVIKQWIQHYVSITSGTPRSQAHLRHFRYMGIQKWSVPAIIGVLPLFLHIALFLFFAGIVVLLAPLKGEIAYIFGFVGGLAFAAYLVALVLPLRYPQCPYRTPLIAHVRPLIAFIAGPFYKLLFRAIPRIVLLCWSAVSLRRPTNRMLLWCERTYHSAHPNYLQMALKDVEIRAATHLGAELDAQSILWLLTFSSNPSVRSIVLQAFCGLAHSLSETRAVLDLDSMQGELQRAIEAQTLSAVRLYANDSDPQKFIESNLFFDIERLLRVSMLFSVDVDTGSHRFAKLAASVLSTNVGSIDRQRLLAYITYVVRRGYYPEHVNQTVMSNIRFPWAEPDANLEDPTHILTSESSLEAQDISIVWSAFYSSMATSPYVSSVMPQDSVQGFIGVCDYLQNLFTLLPPRLPRGPQLSTPKDDAMAAIVHFVYGVLGYVLPQSATRHLDGTTIAHTDPLKLWLLLLLGINEIRDGSLLDKMEPTLSLVVERLMSRLRNYTAPLTDSTAWDPAILKIVNTLFSWPLLGTCDWNADTYTSIFNLYVLLNRHESDNSHPGLPKLLNSINKGRFAEALFQSLLELPDLEVGYLSGLTSNIALCLRVHQENIDTLTTVITVLLGLHWFEVAADIREKPIAPLVNVLLQLIRSAKEQQDEFLVTIAQQLIDDIGSNSRVLCWLCSIFIIEDHPSIPRITFEPDANSLLELAESTIPTDAWSDALHIAVGACQRLCQAVLENPTWKPEDYERYSAMADFIDTLINIVDISISELQAPRLDAAGKENLRWLTFDQEEARAQEESQAGKNDLITLETKISGAVALVEGTAKFIRRNTARTSASRLIGRAGAASSSASLMIKLQRSGTRAQGVKDLVYVDSPVEHSESWII